MSRHASFDDQDSRAMEGMPDKEKQEEKDGTKEGQPNQQLLTLTTESDYMVVTTPTTFKRDNRHVGQANEWREEMSPESALISNDVTPLMVDLVTLKHKIMKLLSINELDPYKT